MHRYLPISLEISPSFKPFSLSSLTKGSVKGEVSLKLKHLTDHELNNIPYCISFDIIFPYILVTWHL